MAIENEDILALKQTISLSAVVRSKGVELKKKGRQLWGLCPFHADTEPSLAVDEGKGLWNCLGKCGTGGDVFSFVMKSDGIGFAEAFASLVQSSEFKVQSRKERPKTESQSPKAETEYLEKAVAYYHKSLVRNEKAIAYLTSRGITAEAVQIFRLGFVDGSLKDKLNPNVEGMGHL